MSLTLYTDLTDVIGLSQQYQQTPNGHCLDAGAKVTDGPGCTGHDRSYENY